MANTVSGSITVKRGDESWTFSFVRQDRSDKSIPRQLHEWMTKLVSDWPVADLRVLARDLLAKLHYKDADGYGMNDIVIEVPSTGGGA